MDDQTLREHLDEFGLSEKEIDTYLAVLETGEAKASTIAERSGVSQRYVYNIAEELEDRGLVDVHDHVVPTKIRAVPPGQAVEGLVGQLKSIQPGLEKRFTETAPETATFEVIKSRQTVVKQIRSLLSTAEKEVFLAVPAQITEDLLPEMRSAVDRGVTVLLLEGNVSPSRKGDADRFEGAADVVRQWDEDMSIMISADSTSGLLGERRLLTGKHDDRQAVILTQTQIVGSLFGSFVSSFWSMGDEVYVADPEPLPETYTMARPAVLQATLRLRADETVRATVEGSPTDSDADRTVSGTVVDTKQGILHPPSNDFPVENSLTLSTDHGRVTVGGTGAFVEDYIADEIRLERE